jgi:hypothetical protein
MYLYLLAKVEFGICLELLVLRRESCVIILQSINLSSQFHHLVLQLVVLLGHQRQLGLMAFVEPDLVLEFRLASLQRCQPLRVLAF